MADTTITSSGLTTSFYNTPQAKDDYFSFAEFNENTLTRLLLNGNIGVSAAGFAATVFPAVEAA